MKANDEKLLELVRKALPKVGDVEPGRDLWPGVLRKFEARPRRVPWYDVALAVALAAMAILFPTAFPVLLYYM